MPYFRIDNRNFFEVISFFTLILIMGIEKWDEISNRVPFTLVFVTCR